MVNEKRLIDTNEAYEIARTSGLHNDFAMSMADLTSLEELFEDCTAVDAVEVVRCKNCEYWTEEKGLGMFCTHWGGMLTTTAPDDFCSYGERRNDEHSKID